MKMIKYASEYANVGWPVFPCNIFKAPMTLHGFKDATTNLTQIQKWWAKQPDALIGCPTGNRIEMFVLDIDVPYGFKSLELLEKRFGKLPATLKQITGGGGVHYFFKCNSEMNIRNSSGKLGQGLDIRGLGGYVILPPSCHKSGQHYRWQNQGVRASNAPTWLLKLINSLENDLPKIQFDKESLKSMNIPSSQRYGDVALENSCAIIKKSRKGTRNATLNEQSFKIGRLVAGGVISQDKAISQLAIAARYSGLSCIEIMATIESGLGAGMMFPRSTRNV